MLPTKNDMHVDKLLSNLLVGYSNDDYIWNRVAPTIDTGGRESDKWASYDKADWFRNTAEVVAPGGPVPLGGYRTSTTTFSCEEYVQGTYIADRDLADANEPFKAKTRASKARWCADRVNMKMEIDLAGDVFTTSVWDNDDTSSTDWDNFDSSTPVDDIEDAKDTIVGNTGKEPNTLILGGPVWPKLKRNPDILDLLGAHERAIATPELLAAALDLDTVLIGKAIKNTAAEGQTASYSRIWGKNALLLYVEPNATEENPTGVYGFEAKPLQVRRWRENTTDHRNIEVIEASLIWGSEVVGSDLGYFFSSIVS